MKKLLFLLTVVLLCCNACVPAESSSALLSSSSVGSASVTSSATVSTQSEGSVSSAGSSSTPATQTVADLFTPISIAEYEKIPYKNPFPISNCKPLIFRIKKAKKGMRLPFPKPLCPKNCTTVWL